MHRSKLFSLFQLVGMNLPKFFMVPNSQTPNYCGFSLVCWSVTHLMKGLEHKHMATIPLVASMTQPSNHFVYSSILSASNPLSFSNLCQFGSTQQVIHFLNLPLQTKKLEWVACHHQIGTALPKLNWQKTLTAKNHLVS